MNDEIIIKSVANNRVRLKSDLFALSSNLELIENEFKDIFIDFRKNISCKSIIFKYNLNITLDSVIERLNNLFNITASIPASKAICGTSCSSCSLKKHDEKSWKRKLFEFALLSGYAIYIFVSENILGATIASTAFSLVGIISFVAAIPLLKESLEDIKQKRFTLQTFMSGTLLLAIFFGEATAAFEIIYILRGGMLLEEYIANRSRQEIQNLVELDVKKVYVLVDDVEIEVNIEELKQNDIVVCRSGEKIPVDGIITQGSAEINEAIINGRSEPEYKKESDEVFAGTVCERGRVFIKVIALGNETYISRTMREVELSLMQKSPSELEADRLANRLLKLGTALTVGTFLLTGSFSAAFSVMIIMSCPCATVLAASTAISGGIANAAKQGILIKGGDALENVSKSEVFCFDKTGTLTTGKPVITDIISLSNKDEKLLLEYAASAEYRNSHPLANSIVKYADEKNIEINQNILSEVIPGFGVKSKIDDKRLLVGNKALLNRYKISLKDYKNVSSKLLNSGKTAVYIALDDEILGVLGFTHEVRKGTKQMIEDLRQRGVKHIALLTGDEVKVANGFALDFGFDSVFANQSPKGKADAIEELKKKYKSVVMVGDGVNDTYAMSKADVAISFAAGGSEAAIAVSDVAITHSHPEDIVNLYDVSKKSLNVVNQNYYIGTSTNLAGVALSAMGRLTPVGAGLIHIGHTIGIMANSSRLAIDDNNS
ncbi:heavy metal translocating P-type ATPase [Halarcobacter anaerophilus]|uniref:P-type Zn(2+) transporter n=1 Tax=Halarcobacter anaerophilus TaxID=877500 RepID=A0A4Q0XWV6_9BACT|nr:cation-translocating P-type ATPase [Halarcobacter anaerophilus]RXJ62056.1 heavy metal translocating P-type ATPase [Halarcobacter anaerophilus]